MQNDTSKFHESWIINCGYFNFKEATKIHYYLPLKSLFGCFTTLAAYPLYFTKSMHYLSTGNLNKQTSGASLASFVQEASRCTRLLMEHLCAFYRWVLEAPQCRPGCTWFLFRQGAGRKWNPKNKWYAWKIWLWLTLTTGKYRHDPSFQTERSGHTV